MYSVERRLAETYCGAVDRSMSAIRAEQSQRRTVTRLLGKGYVTTD